MISLRKPHLAALLSLPLAGAGCATRQELPAAAFPSTQTLAVGNSVRFDDGLNLKLARIEDSRCRQGLQCVWAGELAPVLELRGGLAGEKTTELRLGTGSAPEKPLGRYRFVLRQATPDSASIAVSRSP